MKGKIYWKLLDDKKFICPNKPWIASKFYFTGFLIGSRVPPPAGFSKVVTTEVTDELRQIQADSCEITDDINPNDVYLFVKQAKSYKLQLWSLQSLSQSNAEITERSPKRDWSQHHCPYNLKETLSNQFIVLSALSWCLYVYFLQLFLFFVFYNMT